MVKYRLIVTDLTNTWISIYWLFIGLYLDLLVPHCTRKLAHIPQTTANKQNLQFLFIWANVAWENYQWNVCPWIRDNSYEKNNLHNVASTMLGLIILSMSSKYAWGNIAQENYFGIVGPQNADDNFPGKICLVACFLTWCSIITQSWLFLFNVGSEVHFQNYRKSTKWP